LFLRRRCLELISRPHPGPNKIKGSEGVLEQLAEDRNEQTDKGRRQQKFQPVLQAPRENEYAAVENGSQVKHGRVSEDDADEVAQQ